MDPTTTSSHEGPACGPGAVFNSEGKRLGKGRMEVASVGTPHRIDIDMTFWRGNGGCERDSAEAALWAGLSRLTGAGPERGAPVSSRQALKP